MSSRDLLIVTNIRITKAIQPSDVIRYYPFVVIPYHIETVMFTSNEHLLMDGQLHVKRTVRSDGSDRQHYLLSAPKKYGEKECAKKNSCMVSNDQRVAGSLFL